jgi:hypothetical protein
VDTPLGIVTMSQLKVGDKVLTKPGKYDTVLYFSRHWRKNEWVRDDSEIEAGYVNIQTRFSDNTVGPTLRISSEHLLPIAESSSNCKKTSVKPARILMPGKDIVIHSSGVCLEVTQSSVHIDQGAYSPITSSGYLIVNEVLVSCYTENSVMLNEQFASVALKTLLFLNSWLPHGIYVSLVDNVDFVVACIQVLATTDRLPFVVISILSFLVRITLVTNRRSVR